MTPQQAFQTALDQLQREIPKAAFDTWVQHTELIAFTDGVFTLGAKNAYARDWLTDRLTSTIDKILSGAMNQAVAVKFVVSDMNVGDDDDHDPDADDSAAIDVEVIYASLRDLITRPNTAVRIPAYVRRWLPYWGTSLGWVYVALTQLAFFNRAKPGTPFRTTLRNIATWSGLGQQTVMHLLNSHPAQWFVKTTGESTYSLLAYLPLTPGDESLVADLLIELGVRDNPVKALRAALGFRRRDILPFPPPAPIRLHLEMAANPRPPVEAILDICRPFSATVANDVERLAGELAAHLMPVQDEIKITHYFIRNHLKALKSGPAWLVTLLRDEGFVSKADGYQNPLPVPGGDTALAQALGYSPDRGRKNQVAEWLSSEGRRSSAALSDFVSREGAEYRFRLQETELLTAGDAKNCQIISDIVQALREANALDMLQELENDTPENVLSGLDQKLAAQMEQIAAQTEQNAAQTEQNAAQTEQNAAQTEQY